MDLDLDELLATRKLHGLDKINDNDIYIDNIEEDIKTILTKESYMANCYKVGGEDE